MELKLCDIRSKGFDAAPWREKGYRLPRFDIDAVRERTKVAPTWLHFGAGNIFRAFPAAALQDLLDKGEYDCGVIVAEGFDCEIIDRAYRPYDNLSLLVVLRADGTAEKRVIAAVTESLRADSAFADDWARLAEVFRAPTLQMISLTVTEKGYAAPAADLQRGLAPAMMMGKLAALLYERYRAGELPVAVQSMDNCSHNGDLLRDAVLAYAETWVEAGHVPAGFVGYLADGGKVSFPWSMIDKITPRPDPKVQAMLEQDGFADRETILTPKGTYTAPFVNAEETGYLVIEDNYPSGRPPLEKAGVLFADRETVDKVEKMKVCTCLNPLHTAMAIFGCLLGYTQISEEMKDDDIRTLVTELGYREGMPVVVDPGVLKPADFLGAVLTKRLPNPFLPDAPQRIATDTSQKLAIRFGETIKAWRERGYGLQELVLIPLVLAAYARYLAGIDDAGSAFAPSPDPLLEELQAVTAPLAVRQGPQDFACLRGLYSRSDIFGLNLYEVGLGECIEGMAAELFAGPGAVRRTLHKYVSAR